MKALSLILCALLVFLVGMAPRPTVADRLYGVARTLGVSKDPAETDEARDARLAMIADAVAAETAPYADGSGWRHLELAVAVFELFYAEARLDRRIHAGVPHPTWTSDHGRAKCLGQIHVSDLIPRSEWETLAGDGLEATRRCARATALVLVWQARQCGVWSRQRATPDRVAFSFAAYGTGGNCTAYPAALTRAREWADLLEKARRIRESPRGDSA